MIFELRIDEKVDSIVAFEPPFQIIKREWENNLGYDVICTTQGHDYMLAKYATNDGEKASQFMANLAKAFIDPKTKKVGLISIDPYNP